LVIDLGGVHSPMTSTIILGKLQPILQIGQNYTIDLFFAQRHTPGIDSIFKF
jgi:fibro-slime domain-containing protein